MNKIFLVPILFLFVGALYFSFALTGNVAAEIIDDGDTVKVALDSIDEDAQFLSYEGIEFFVVRSSGGDVKTAFNACDVCYSSRKGYRQEGGDVVCNNCGNHYKVSGLGTANLKGGGCWPGHLSTRMDGDFLVIDKSDLEAGIYRFA